MRRLILLAVPVAVLAACRMPSNESLRDEKSEAKPTAAPAAGAPAETPAGKIEAQKTPARAPARPAPTPAPVKRIAEGTALSVVFETTASSDKSQAGDAVVAKLAADVKDGERVVLPAGAELRGEVLAAQGSGRVKGRARLAVAFMKLVADGTTYDIQTTAIDVTAQAQKGRDAKIIGGAAGAGALIGAIAGGGKGAAKGAAIGGAAGGGAVLATKGKEVVFAAGSKHEVTLKTSVTLD
jgi:hypothetical protein